MVAPEPVSEDEDHFQEESSPVEDKGRGDSPAGKPGFQLFVADRAESRSSTSGGEEGKKSHKKKKSHHHHHKKKSSKHKTELEDFLGGAGDSPTVDTSAYEAL